MQETRLRLHLALGAARMSIWDATVVGNDVTEGVISWSPDAAGLVGLPPVEQEQSLHDFLGLVPPEDRAYLVERMQQRVDNYEADGHEMDNPVLRCLRDRNTVGVSSRAQLLARDGRRIAIEDTSAPIWSRDGDVLGAVVVLHDVTHERKLTSQLSWQAAHDPLTALINRRAFEAAVADALRSAKDDGHHHALLYMDLDRFKIVNDTCGHGAGDLLLQTISRLLQQHMRESDVLARIGGDELGVICRTARCRARWRWPTRCARRPRISASCGATACSRSACRSAWSRSASTASR
jgi:GGDEF domain-containing protein